LEVFNSYTLIDWYLTPTFAVFQPYRGMSTDIQHFKLSNIFSFCLVLWTNKNTEYLTLLTNWRTL